MQNEETTEEPSASEPEGDKITVEVAEDKAKPRLTDEEVAKLADLPADDEIGRYAKEAQRRIKNLHIAGQEWRRRVVQSSKDVATATNLAEQLYRENQALKARAAGSEAALIEQAVRRAEAQLAQAKQAARVAYAAQDADAIVAANEEVSRFVAEADRLRLLKAPVMEKGQSAPAASGAAPAPAPVSEATRQWTERNSWFGKPGEEEITGFALGIHQSLEKQGITEVSSPDQYWSTINRRLREVYPERFKTVAAVETPRRPVTVTGGQRTNGGAPSGSGRHVTLTESQVRIAHSLGLTNEQYATQLVKEEKERDREKARSSIQ